MDNLDIIEKVNNFLVEEFEVSPEEITPEADLKKTLDLDSLDYIDLVVVIQNTFGFRVKPEDFTDISTFQDFYTYVINRLTAKENA